MLQQVSLLTWETASRVVVLWEIVSVPACQGTSVRCTLRPAPGSRPLLTARHPNLPQSPCTRKVVAGVLQMPLAEPAGSPLQDKSL